MPFEIVQGNIVRQTTDAIVNAANEQLLAGGGVCGAIFAAAGAERLQAACDALGGCPTGQSVITPGFALPARYVIHTVGPVWRGGGSGEEKLLRSCYQSALELAKSKGLASVCFPLISAGVYGYPRDQALSVAVSAIGGFLKDNEMTVRLVIFDRSEYHLSDELHRSLERVILSSQPPPLERARNLPPLSALRSRLRGGGIDATYSGERVRHADVWPGAADRQESVPAPLSETHAVGASAPESGESELRDLKRALNRVEDGFSPTLLMMIDRRGKTDPEVYKRANLDRKLFSKIRSNPAYRPSKNTALALCVALELNLDQTADLLRRAGYALSPASRADVIVQYFIQERNYDIFEINQALFAFDESLLGA